LSESLRSLRNRSFHGSEKSPSLDGGGCQHERIRAESAKEGGLLVIRTYCGDCGKLLDERRIPSGPELRRCPLDPKLDHCITGCPVEEGSPDIFEHPCLPLMWAIEDATGRPRILPTKAPKSSSD